MTSLVPSDSWVPVGVESLETTAENVVRSSKNTLVVAGPGAGKTELLAQRACYLLETGKCPAPQRILAISFKRDAAKNLQERVQKRCGDRAQRFDSFTLDAFAKSLVDRFMQASPNEWRPNHYKYEVMTSYMNVRDKRAWLSAIGVPKGYQTINFHEFSDSEINRMFDSMAHGHVLPYHPIEVDALERYRGLRWWKDKFIKPLGIPHISFPMLNRLSAYILRCNPILCQALQATYGFVFLDEFQDTTAAQYDLIRAAFRGSDAVLTAVGDTKQRIMIWAGAMHNVFDFFKNEFSTESEYLLSNYRSAPELVQMQHVIAQILENGTPPPIAARTALTGSCAVLEFSNPEDEAVFLADKIEKGIHEGKAHRDFCIIVRQLAGNMIQILKRVLAERGIKLRDESQLQDLLAEPVTKFILSILRLSTRPRDPEAWEMLSTEIALLLGIDENNDGIQVEQEARRLLQHTRTAINSGQTIDSLPQDIITMIGTSKFQSTYRQYARGSYLKNTVDSLAEALLASSEITDTVRETVDDILGLNVVPAMTIHKSKGLEFSTVIFMGLEDSQWWNFSNQPDEEKRGFFVAFSRAIECVYFTFSDYRDGRWGRREQNRGQISDLYSVLKQACVPIKNCRF